MERNTAKRTLEKLLSVCICLCMLGAMLPAQVFAEEADTAQTENRHCAVREPVHRLFPDKHLRAVSPVLHQSALPVSRHSGSTDKSSRPAPVVRLP